MYESEVEGRRDKRKSCTKWLDRGKEACNARSLDLREAKVKRMDIGQWRQFFELYKCWMVGSQA